MLQPWTPSPPTASRERIRPAFTSELEHYRDLLLAKRRELVGDMSPMEREALRTSGGTNLSTLPIHMADMGTDNYEQEFTLGLVEKTATSSARSTPLAKIQNGTYGICEGTGKPISKARLEAQPWARFSPSSTPENRAAAACASITDVAALTIAAATIEHTLGSKPKLAP